MSKQIWLGRKATSAQNNEEYAVTLSRSSLFSTCLVLQKMWMLSDMRNEQFQAFLLGAWQLVVGVIQRTFPSFWKRARSKQVGIWAPNSRGSDVRAAVIGHPLPHSDSAWWPTGEEVWTEANFLVSMKHGCQSDPLHAFLGILCREQSINVWSGGELGSESLVSHTCLCLTSGMSLTCSAVQPFRLWHWTDTK